MSTAELIAIFHHRWSAPVLAELLRRNGSRFAALSGTLGVGRVARAAPDGYTLSIGTLTTHALIGGLYALPFDLLTDFEPIA